MLLNADYRPIRILSWERAFALWFDGKVDLVSGYVDEFVRSAREAFEKPAVVRLRRYVDVHARVRFNRQNVLARDGYECGYCGERPVRGSRPDLEALTLDHVVPRAQARNGQVRLPWGGDPVASGSAVYRHAPQAAPVAAVAASVTFCRRDRRSSSAASACATRACSKTSSSRKSKPTP